MTPKLESFGFIVNQGVIRRAVVVAINGPKRVKVEWKNSVRSMSRIVGHTDNLDSWLVNPNGLLFVGDDPHVVAGKRVHLIRYELYHERNPKP